MIICPNCGAEYTVDPEKCAVCGAELEEHSAPDLFAAALEQEKTAESKRREIREQFHRMRTTKPEPDAMQSEASAEDPAEQDEVQERPAQSKKNPRGLKIAAGLTAAVLLTGTAVYAWNGDKPSGFVRSNTAAVYLKDKSLWIFNGQDGKTMCLHDDVIPDNVFNQCGIPVTRLMQDMVHFSEDGETVYYPVFHTDVAVDTGEWVIVDYMSRRFSEPATETKVAEINTLHLYGNEDRTYGYVNQSPLHTGDQPLSQSSADLPFLFCGDALYYRNADGAFCCTENGETTELAPGVQRFWQVPGTEGIYYLVTDNPNNEGRFPASYYSSSSFGNSKNDKIENMHVDESTFELIDLWGSGSESESAYSYAPFRLYHLLPGAEPEEICMTDGDPESIVTRFYSINVKCPQYLYYTLRTAEQKKELRRIEVTTGASELIMDEEKFRESLQPEKDPDCSNLAYIVHQIYPDGSCYFGVKLGGGTTKIVSYNYDPYDSENDNQTNSYFFTVEDPDASESNTLYAEPKNVDVIAAAERAIMDFDMGSMMMFYYDPKSTPDVQYLTEVSLTGSTGCAAAAEEPYLAVIGNTNSVVRFYHGAEKMPSEDKTQWPYFGGMLFSPHGSLFLGVTMFHYDGTIRYSDDSSPEDETDDIPPFEYCMIRLTPQGAGTQEHATAARYFEINAEKPELLWLKKPLVVDKSHYGDYILSSDNGDLGGRVSPGSCRYSPKRDALYYVNETQKPASLAADKRLVLGRESYYGTLECYRDGQKKEISEAVSDFYPYDTGEDEILYLISNTDSQTGALCFMSERKRYCADYHATRLLAVLPVPEKK